jgi:hypothetical protein
LRKKEKGTFVCGAAECRLFILGQTRAALAATLRSDGGRLVKPDIKLTMSVTAGIGGILLSPLTGGVPLLMSAASAAVTAWDTLDYVAATAHDAQAHLLAAALRRQAGAGVPIALHGSWLTLARAATRPHKQRHVHAGAASSTG